MKNKNRYKVTLKWLTVITLLGTNHHEYHNNPITPSIYWIGNPYGVWQARDILKRILQASNQLYGKKWWELKS